MANIKEYRIVADVPFCWVNDMDAEDVKRIASLTLGPHEEEGQVAYSSGRRFVDNDHGGRTAMYTLYIEGRSGASCRCFKAVCESILKLNFVKLHIAEYRDVQFEIYPWEHIVDPALLSGEVVSQ